jgi:PAS domain-containing protein
MNAFFLTLIAFAVLAAALAVCAASSLRGRRSRAQLTDQNVLLDAALNNMTQGVNMFDAAGRLLLWNERYIEMYRLPREALKPGLSVQDLVRLRLTAGTFFRDIDPARYSGELTTSMIERKATRATRELADGRIITVVNQPMLGGGWA